MAFPRPFGRYLLDERLAMGGMAEIFRGRTSTAGFEKKVCIKRILPHFTEQQDFVTMFRDEAALAARLQHANIVQVFDFGSEEDMLFLAMELVDGCDLRKLLDLAKKQAVPVGIGHAMQITIEICRGLHHAHTLCDDDGNPIGIVHRDISPHNVLVSRAGEVKVTDFGIAKASARATHTGTGVVKGKLAYMAPEQANSKPFDQRVDQFATGIVLWEMLTGERLFSGPDEVTVLRKVMLCEVPRPSTLRADLPAALEDIIMRALAEEPAERFPDMRHLEHALSRCLFEVTSDPEETNLRPIVEAVLGPPEASRRNTAVLVENPVMSAPGESIPSLTAAGFSEVFSTSGEVVPAVPRDDIASALGDESAPSVAATIVSDKSSSNPVARTPQEGTGVTRTIVPDNESAAQALGSTVPIAAALPLETASPPSHSSSSSSSLAPVAAAASPATASASSPVVPSAPSAAQVHARERSLAWRTQTVVTAAGIALLAMGVGALVAVGTDDAAASDEVKVTVATPADVVANARAEPPAARAADDDDEAVGSGSPPAGDLETGAPAAEDVPPSEAEAPAATTTGTAASGSTAQPAAQGDVAVPAAAVSRASSEPKGKAAPVSAREPASQQRTQRTRSQGKLLLEMSSGWAHAYLGKRKLCETPCTVELPAGSHLLRLKSGDGSERRHRVTVKADTTVRSVVPPP